jgi:predicted nucleic acid-binding protein
VRGETWTLINRREDHAAAVRFLDAVAASPRLRVVQVAESQEATAMTWLRSHDEREYSFVDATSFAVMRALGIDRALAYDGDFAAAGFAELR